MIQMKVIFVNFMVLLTVPIFVLTVLRHRKISAKLQGMLRSKVLLPCTPQQMILHILYC